MTAVQNLRAITVLAACALAQAASAACYSVYTPEQELIYRSNRPPVDLTLPLHQTVDKIERGATMVFTLDEFNCITEINLLAEREQLARARQERQRDLGRSSTPRRRQGGRGQGHWRGLPPCPARAGGLLHAQPQIVQGPGVRRLEGYGRVHARQQDRGHAFGPGPE